MEQLKFTTKQRIRGKKKNLCRYLATLFFILIFTQMAFSQSVNINGKITDESGNTLTGAIVAIKGTTKGVITNIDGLYTIQASVGDVLLYSFIGYVSKEATVTKGTTSMNVILETDTKDLQEVVVVGYGTQRKEDLSSSVASVKSEDFMKGSVKSIGQLIQGKVAGLSISNISGDPKSDVEIMLRGAISINGNATPLVVIDGIPGGKLSMVAPEDIESIDILKDGSAAAIYGTRANSGVILITTKKGSKNTGGNVKVSINSYANYDMVNKRIEVLDGDQYRKLITDVGSTVLADKELDLKTIDKGYNTDWIGELLSNKLNYSHHISVQGGTETSSILGTVTYKKNDGIWLKTGRNSLKTRLNYTQSLFDNKLNFDFNVINQMSNYQDFNQESFRQAIYRNPTDRVLDNDGKYIEDESILFYYNPVSMIKERIDEGKDNETMLSGKVTIEPIKNFKISAQGSLQLYNSLDGYASNNKHMDYWAGGRNRASRSTYLSDTRNLDIIGEYKKTFEKHSFNLLGGYSFFQRTTEGFSASNSYFPTDAFGYNDLGLGKGTDNADASMSSDKRQNRLIAFFGRLNYNYSDRYLLSASIRHEGSTKFGKDNKWGNFPSISGAWRVSKESFFSSDLINDLKVRVGYGITGSEPSDPYMSQLTFGYTDANNQFYYNNQFIKGVIPVRQDNPNLKWEKKAEIDFGIDIAILKNKVSATIDYYQRKTSDMIWNYNVPSPPNLAREMYANVGELENKGLEIGLNVLPVSTKDFDWSFSVNYSTNKNELLSLSNDTYKMANDYLDRGYPGNPIQTFTHRIQVGKPIGDFYSFKAIGLDNTGKWIYENVSGDVDADGAPIINDEDKMVIGNGVPKHNLGFTNNFRYKNFDLALSCRGAFGFQVLNFFRMHYQPLSSLPGNVSVFALEKPYNNQYVVEAAKYNSYYVENGDYLKISNIDLGYNIKLAKNNQASMRIYLSLNNFFTFTKYTGLDPEVNINGLTPGYDNVGFGGVDDNTGDNPGTYPSLKTVTAGININF